MLNLYSKKLTFVNQVLTGLILCSLLFSALPLSAFAQEASSTPPTTDVSGCTDELALNYNADATVDDGSCQFAPAPDETASTTDETGGGSEEPTATSTDETATSTDDGTGTDGADGQNADPGDTATTTATSTDDGTGSSGTEGGSGADGEPSAPEAQAQESDPLPIISDELIGDEDPSEEEEVTGGIETTGANATIRTGDATARGDVTTDANSNNVRSQIEASGNDFDTYTFNATGTNDASVVTDGVILAATGENTVSARNIGGIQTGHAVSAFNIANVVNSNIVNSDGYIYLANEMVEEGKSLDLSGFFFPDEEEVFGLAADCDLLSCAAEDVIYNFSQTNNATITNNAKIEANTGENLTQPVLGYTGAFGEIVTGNAYAGANVINVVNTNIVDSNYRLLTYNAMGDLNGDLVLPTQELFHAFFGRPNGLTQYMQQEFDEGTLNVDSANNAQLVDNNVDSNAQTGGNKMTTSAGGDIDTGMAESESNILNKINENTFGGDSMYLLIRIHGYWNGEIIGLPDGLTWAWTPEGVIIYNEDAEIAPSILLGYDKDSYTANMMSRNDVYIENNLDVDAITGNNEVKALAGSIRTGDAVASANVMNIANTNVIGANWTFAVINIMGNFDGNIAFSKTDLGLTGSAQVPRNPLKPGDVVTFSFTVKNNSDVTAHNVTLTQILQNAHANSTDSEIEVPLGDLAPGQSKNVNLQATVNSGLPNGTTTVRSLVEVRSDEADVTENNNVMLHTFVAEVIATGTDAGTTTEPDDETSTSTDPGLDDSATSTDQTGDGEVLEDPIVPPPVVKKSGGGGGGGNKTTTKKVERIEAEVDPNAPPLVVIKKKADVDEDDIVTAGDEVNYTITVTNKGGQAYDAVVYDTLKSPIGAVLTKEKWDLGTIKAGEIIELTYTTTYDFKTPSGKYKNTASIEAYRNEDDKENGIRPLIISDAVYTIEIEGVPLAVGNIGVLAVFPGANGTVSALVAWETSKDALSQIFYGPKSPWFTSSEKLYNYGFPQQGFKFTKSKVSHATIINGLRPGQEYAYRIDAHTSEYDALSRELTFTVPASVGSLAVNVGTGFMTAQQILSRVAGVSTSVPAPAPAPKPYVPPAAPAPAPTPAPEPQPTAAAEPAPQSDGLIGKVKNSLFGFFR